MDLLGMILQSNEGRNVKELAGKFGLDVGQTESAVKQLVPALTKGLQRETRSPEGLEGLLGALQSGNHQRYVDDPASVTRSETIEDGNGILGHIFGSKDVSRRVASRAADSTGLDSGILKQMLPIVATMVMGSMSKQANREGLASAGSKPSPGVAGMLSSMLDKDDDGSVTDDLFDLAKKFF